MGGAWLRRCRRLIILCACVCLGAFQLRFAEPAHAIGNLEFAKDVISDLTPNHVNVGHDIAFVLPTTSQQITPSDYLLITFTNFSTITPPTSMIGAFGNATYSIVGKTVKITNFALLPGNAIEILGLTARNPAPGFDYQVTIAVADDANGTTIRNRVTVIAGAEGNIYEVSAAIQSPLSSVDLSGYTSPNAFLTLTEGGTVIGTTSANPVGFFDFPVSGIDPGNHTFRISSTDTQERTSSQSVIQLFLLQGTLTTASGILISPTIQISTTSINVDDPLTFSGSARPNSTITLFTESPLRSYSTTSDSGGNWSYLIPGTETHNYTPGQYRGYSNVQDTQGNQSIVSPTLSFTVISPNDNNNPAPTCDISQGDLNCDTKTNLTDFSILLFHWKTNHKVADINGDGVVNLVDFSIMMFYFRRS